MTGNMGGTRRISAFVITGNSNGLTGFALGKAQGGQAALRKAKNPAAQKLIYTTERYKDRTGNVKFSSLNCKWKYNLIVFDCLVLHDFYTSIASSFRKHKNLCAKET
jgi:Ribosomal protein S5, N-terminal domain